MASGVHPRETQRLGLSLRRQLYAAIAGRKLVGSALAVTEEVLLQRDDGELPALKVLRELMRDGTEANRVRAADVAMKNTMLAAKLVLSAALEDRETEDTADIEMTPELKRAAAQQLIADADREEQARRERVEAGLAKQRAMGRVH